MDFRVSAWIPASLVTTKRRENKAEESEEKGIRRRAKKGKRKLGHGTFFPMNERVNRGVGEGGGMGFARTRIVRNKECFKVKVGTETICGDVSRHLNGSLRLLVC